MSLYISTYELSGKAEKRISDAARGYISHDAAVEAVAADARAWADYSLRFNLPDAKDIERSNDEDISRDLMGILNIKVV